MLGNGSNGIWWLLSPYTPYASSPVLDYEFEIGLTSIPIPGPVLGNNLDHLHISFLNLDNLTKNCGKDSSSENLPYTLTVFIYKSRLLYSWTTDEKGS